MQSRYGNSSKSKDRNLMRSVFPVQLFSEKYFAQEKDIDRNKVLLERDLDQSRAIMISRQVEICAMTRLRSTGSIVKAKD